MLLAEGASLGELGLSSGWLAEDGVASNADDDGGGVREDGRNLEASRALNVHEVGVWVLNKTLKLVASDLPLWLWVKKVNGQRHFYSTC